MSSPWRIIGEFLVDFFISIALFLLACLLSGAAQKFFTPDLIFLYGLWFMLAMLPLIFYVRWRQKLNFDLWDFLVYGGAAFVSGLFAQFFPTLPSIGLALVAAAIVWIVAFSWEKYRAKNFPRPVSGDSSLVK